MKWKITSKFVGEPERTSEVHAWNPMLFIGQFCYEQTKMPSGGEWLKWQVLEYYRVERLVE